MSVTDFECAIAKSQIARYIAGENLAPEISRQLEAHITACPRCKQLLQEKKNSLEAMIEDKSGAETRTEINIPTQSVPMVSGSMALKPEPTMEPATAAKSDIIEEDQPRLSLRDKLREQARALTQKEENTIDIPTVAPAFAHKDNPQGGIKLKLEESEQPKKKKKGFSLSSLALYRRVPDEVEEQQPAMTVENIRAAKETLKRQPNGFRRPMMYMVGLCAVIAAMSFFLKDPTSLFGGKVASQDQPTKSKPVKATPIKKTPKLSNASVKRQNYLSPSTTNAESFIDTATDPAAMEPSGNQAPTKAPAKPVVKPKVAAKVKPAAVKPATKKVAAKKPAAPKATKKAPVAVPTVSHKPIKKAAKKPVAKAHSTAHAKSKQNVVKLYAPETAASKEQK